MGPVFDIGLIHFLIVSILLVAAGVATILTKRNAIGILIGIELILNAASINLVAFNRYSWPSQPQTDAATSEMQPRTLPATSIRIIDTGVNPADLDRRIDELMSSTRPATQPIVANGNTGGTNVNAAPVTPTPAIDGQMFAVFIIVLAAAEAAVALAIFLNFYNNFSSIDVERAEAMKG